MAQNPTTTTTCPLLALPLELRLDIYSYLLCSYPDPIFVSPRRRQVYLRRAPEDPSSSSSSSSSSAAASSSSSSVLSTPAGAGQKSKRKRRKNKPVPLPPGQRQPYVEVLRTCRQVNEEATPVLYGGQNTFVVAWFRLQPYHPPSFFPWYLRQSTLAQIRRITFQSGCYCAEKWVAEAARSQAWTTTGARLARKCFPHVNYGYDYDHGYGHGYGGKRRTAAAAAVVGSGIGNGNGSSGISGGAGKGRGGGGEVGTKGEKMMKRQDKKPVVMSSSLLPMGRRAKEAYEMVTNEIVHDRRVVPTVCLPCHLKLVAHRRSKTGLYTQRR
ncbi:hypothetical protein F5X99DRAFT_56679 [Biscogniauxia marginata]|nr:hypothetical protein F5X99DRAFT_56679 [Biscogniauxia marginata]